jgi:hypothetical protein
LGEAKLLRISDTNAHLENVPTGDSGINKPFDRILKAFAEEAPKLFLRLLGMASEADIQPMRTETAPPMAMPDYVAMLRRGGKDLIFHAEFEARYHSGIPLDMAAGGVGAGPAASGRNAGQGSGGWILQNRGDGNQASVPGGAELGDGSDAGAGYGRSAAVVVGAADEVEWGAGAESRRDCGPRGR